MKRKSIFALIIVVVALTTGRFGIANAIVQSETSQARPVNTTEQAERRQIATVNETKSKTTYAADVADPAYEDNLSEEQRAFNDMINKQIYKETAEEIQLYYEVYGLGYDVEENQMYFNGVPVCCLIDNLATDGTFMGTELHSPNGDIGIVAERDAKGSLTGLKQISGQELTDILSKSWHT